MTWRDEIKLHALIGVVLAGVICAFLVADARSGSAASVRPTLTAMIRVAAGTFAVWVPINLLTCSVLLRRMITVTVARRPRRRPAETFAADHRAVVAAGRDRARRRQAAVGACDGTRPLRHAALLGLPARHGRRPVAGATPAAGARVRRFAFMTRAGDGKLSAMDPFLRAAIDEAKLGLTEGGLPIGSVLVRNDQIIARGHNRRVQHGDPMAHAEIDCLTNAGRQKTYKRHRPLLDADALLPVQRRRRAVRRAEGDRRRIRQLPRRRRPAAAARPTSCAATASRSSTCTTPSASR